MRYLSVLLLGALLALAGVSLAGASGSGYSLYGCVTGTSRTMDDVHTHSIKCPSSGWSASWGHQGPAGPQGPPGTQGVPGPAGVGTAGADGLDVQVVAQTGLGSVTVACPVDHPYVLGGGYSAGDPVVTSVPRMPSPPFTSTADTGGWVVTDPNGADNVSAWALCAR